jgi:hypothetical protein
MAFRWKPNAAMRERYKTALKESENYAFVGSSGPIRTGDALEWVDKLTCVRLAGVVVRHSYGEATGQHTFTIGLREGGKKLVKGRNLYDRILSHQKGG